MTPLATILVLVADSLATTTSTTEQRQAIAAIQRAGAAVLVDESLPGKPVVEINIDTQRATNVTLPLLYHFPQLRKLLLFGCKVSDQGLASIGAMKNLESLAFLEVEVADNGLRHLAGLHRLEELGLLSSTVRGAGLSFLPRLPRLRRLYLGCDKLTEVGFEHVSRLSDLHTLSLSGTPLTNAKLRHLRGMTGLRKLDLNRFADLTPTGIDLDRVEGEVRVGARMATGLSDEGMVHLAVLAQLESLNLSFTGIGHSGLAQLKELSSLQVLDVSGNPRIGNKEMVHFKRMRALRSLNLSGTQVTDDGLRHLHVLANLRELYLRECIRSTPVTDAGIERLRTALPQLKVIRKLPELEAEAP